MTQTQLDPVTCASKTGRPTHRIVRSRLWDIDEAACGASTHRYKITSGAASDVTCLRCCLSGR